MIRDRTINAGVVLALLVVMLAVGVWAGFAVSGNGEEAVVVDDGGTEYLTPPECIRALDLASDAATVAADFADLFVRLSEISVLAVEAAAFSDVAGLNEATAMVEELGGELDALNDRLPDPDEVGEASRVCRSHSA